ncbi:MAG: glycerophosphodiester phosphodiesterase [Lachnospiraceae bacterium]|nr:glycerophosphodiester phosphodiesterase [Lachnospiraceae bacterium]
MRTIKVLGHRGASGYAPENSMQAFEMALDMGADGIELDVHLTKDGEIVVIHDETINRTSNGTGWVKDMTLEELRQYNYNYQNRVDAWSGATELGEVCFPEYDHVEIPTMREVFELVAPTDKMINIELKTGIVFYPIEEKIMEMVKEYHMQDRVWYSSFNHYSIMKIKELDPNAYAGFLYMDGTLRMPEYARDNKVEALHPALYNLQYPGYLEACHQYGIDLNVWTVNQPEHLQMCKQAGVTSVITNYPDLALEIMENADLSMK